MEKYRVYELAKELNTTSKRLMEKLSEINIEVKNHMSLLTDEELKSLYKHIGVIQHTDEKKAEAEEKKVVQQVTPANAEVKKEVKKDIKSAPRIIRTTEIIIDTKTDSKDSRYGSGNYGSNNANYGSNNANYGSNNAHYNSNNAHYGSNNNRYDSQKGGYRSDMRNNASSQDVIRKADSNSGLRSGFTRDTRPLAGKDQRQPQAAQPKAEAPKEIQKPEVAAKKPEVQKEPKPVVEKEASAEPKKAETSVLFPK